MELDILSAWKDIQKSDDPTEYTNFLKYYSFLEEKFGPLEDKTILKEAYLKIQKFLLKFLKDQDKKRILNLIDTLAIKLSTSTSHDVLGYAASLLYDLAKLSLNGMNFQYCIFFIEKCLYFCILAKSFLVIYGFANITAATAWYAIKNWQISLDFAKTAVNYCEETLQRQSEELEELHECLFLSYFIYGKGLKKTGDLLNAKSFFEKAKKFSKLRPEISSNNEIAFKIVKLPLKIKKITQELNKAAFIRIRPGPIKKNLSQTSVKRPSTVYKNQPYCIKDRKSREITRSFMKIESGITAFSKNKLSAHIHFPKFDESKFINSLNSMQSKSSFLNSSGKPSDSKSSSGQSDFKDLEKGVAKKPVLEVAQTKSFQITENEFEKILILVHKAYFQFTESEFSFYYSKQSRVITVKVTLNNKVYKLDYKVTTNKNMTDMIMQDILPYLDLENDELVIGKIKGLSFLEAYFYLNHINGLFRFTIQQPRCFFSAQAITEKQNFSLVSSIETFAPFFKQDFFEVAKEKFLALYTVEENKLKIIFPVENKFEMLYYNKDIRVNDIDYYIKISSINFSNDRKFVVESINTKNGRKSYCVINRPYLAEFHGIKEELTGRNIEILVKLLTVKFGQIKLNQKTRENILPKSLILNNRLRRKRITTIQCHFRGFAVRKALPSSKGITIYITNKRGEVSVLSFIYNYQEKTLKLVLIHKQLEYHYNIRSPIPIKWPYYKNLKKSIILDKFPLIAIGKNLEKFSLAYNSDFINSNELILNRIIFRSGIRINSKQCIVSMILSKSFMNEVILVFKIQQNIFTEPINTTSIDLETVSEKTEIPKQNLVALGYFIVRYMLIVKGPDIIYIDLSKSKLDTDKYARKIQSVFRGHRTRKRLPKGEKKKLLIKKKACLKGENWTIIVFERDSSLPIYMVKGAVVLSIEINMKIIEAFCTLITLKDYAVKSLIPLLDIKEVNGKLQMTGLESLVNS